MKLSFTKMHGCGNNYIYFNCFDQTVPNPEELSVRLSEPHFGIGGDGILTVGMGMPPFTRFTNAGIKVYSDTTEPNVGNVARLFAEGKVALMDPANACRH